MSSSINTEYLPTLSNPVMVVPHQRITGKWSCLIATYSSEAVATLTKAAESAGWGMHVCGDVASALKTMCRQQIKLAFIDFASCDESQIGTYKKLVEHISWIGGVLVVANGPSSCSTPDEVRDQEELERWVREAGVWSYLPGRSENAELRELFEQGLEIVRKLNGAAPAKDHALRTQN